MSKKSKIFTYGTGKRKIGHSKFDMSFTNTYSQGFGALNPVACYETLPDDFWNIGTDGVTLLKPLAAPAFSDIKQHYYAFSVRNSAIWEHWNDFITNGTAFSDVYGSNASNQSAGNPWVVPQINAGYLQDICKIGSGYGVPVYIIDSDAINQDLEDVFTACGVTFDSSITSVQDVTALFMYLIEMPQFLEYLGSSGSVLREMLRESLICAQAKYDSTLSGTYKYKFRLYIAGTQAYGNKLSAYFTTSAGSVGSAATNARIGYDSFQSSQEDRDSAIAKVWFLQFFNDAISRCKLSESPFFFEPVTYSATLVASGVYNQENIYKSYRYIRRFAEVPVEVRFEYANTNSLCSCRSVNGTFTGRYYIFEKGTPGYCAVCDQSRFWFIHSDSRIVDPSNSWSGFLESVQTVSNAVAPYFGVVLHMDEYICSPYGYMNTDTDGFLAPSFMLPVPAFLGLNSPYSSTSPYNAARSLGFDGDSFSVYLCQNSLRLLDGYNLPVPALACRSYFYYRYQDFNALPFFANCKIWDEFFRNTVVSSPELDYCKTNGQILFDNELRDFQSNTTFPTPDRLPEKYADLANPVSSWPLNSWVIPFESIPLNGMLSEGLALNTSSIALVVSLSGHHNQLVIRDRVDVFRLLTGFCLDFMVLDKMYHLFVSQTSNNSVTYRTFSELFTKNFYLPNYYNGLLHLKYQNFNKDYFTSAMLDPMSGANQVAIGSTVTENRLAETKQSWFERIAQQRSVKGFIEAIWGTTPTLDEKMPKFLGSEHVPVNIGEVIQTSASTATSPQGQRVGIGGSRGGSALVHGHVNEHGWLIVLSSFTVESQYCQGLEKQLIPVDSYMDYPTIDFAHVGNESIFMKELNFDGQPYIPFNQEGFGSSEQGPAFTFYNRKGMVMYGYGNPRRVVYSPGSLSSFPSLSSGQWTQDFGPLHGYFLSRRNVARATGTSLDHIFGYIPRYSSYKFKLDQVHGEFRDELEFWHTFRYFYGMPILSHEFVNWELCADDNEFNRIFAVTTDSDNKFLCETHFTASVDRALPYVCVPQSK